MINLVTAGNKYSCKKLCGGLKMPLEWVTSPIYQFWCVKTWLKYEWTIVSPRGQRSPKWLYSRSMGSEIHVPRFKLICQRLLRYNLTFCLAALPSISIGSDMLMLWNLKTLISKVCEEWSEDPVCQIERIGQNLWPVRNLFHFQQYPKWRKIQLAENDVTECVKPGLT